MNNKGSGYDKSYNAKGVQWAFAEGAITEKQESAFYQHLSEINKQNGYRLTTASGEDIFIPRGDARGTIIISNGDYRKPIIHRIYNLDSSHFETIEDMQAAREVIENAERSYSSTRDLEQARRAVEIVFGEGTVSFTDRWDSRAHAWKDELRKGSPRRAANRAALNRESTDISNQKVTTADKSNPQNSGRASAEVAPELSDEEKIRLFGEPEASDIVEAESYDRMEKKEAVQYAKDHNYPMLRRADGREEQAVPGWSWVRDNARKNYGRVIGDAIVNGEPGVEVEFYNKKKGTSRMIGKLPGEVTLVDPQVGGRNVPVGEAPAETDIDALGGDPRSDEMMEEMVGDRTFSTAEPIGSKNPQRRETLREAYERRTEAYMAATNRNDTEYDYDGELAWIKRAEQLLAEQQKKGPKITEMEKAQEELLEVGEATVRNDTGTYIMKVRKKGDKKKTGIQGRKNLSLDYFRRITYNIPAVFGKAALVGEPAVPCHLQSATAGMNSRSRICGVPSDGGKRR